jgi:hypothetical protein
MRVTLGSLIQDFESCIQVSPQSVPFSPRGTLGTGPAQQIRQRQRHHPCAVHHVVDADPFVGLMREFEDAGPVGDAVLQPADPVDMLLVVGAGRDDEGGLAPQHALQRATDGATTGASRSVIEGCTSNRSRIS